MQNVVREFCTHVCIRVALPLVAWVRCDQKGTTWARAHKCTNVCKPYRKTASNRHAAPSDSTAAVPVPQETDMRSPYKPSPLLLVTGVHAGGPTRGVRTN